MSLRVTCPECDAVHKIDEKYAGRTVICSQCQHRFRAEAPEADAPRRSVSRPQGLPRAPSAPGSRKGASKAPNERVCLGFARDQATRHRLQNIKHDNLGVGGSRDNFFAVMTCVGNVIVVMVAGDTGTNGSPLAKELFDAVRGEGCIDGC